jgi:hypothetical protein
MSRPIEAAGRPAEATARPRLVFVTYYRLVPTGQIGIFKRCLRLLSRLLDDFDVHLVNFGPLPETDPLFAAVRPRLAIHPPPEEDLGTHLHDLFSDLGPVAVVLGETPIRGSMRLAHRVATALGIWQIALDNYYGPLFPPSLTRDWPRVDRWLLLGLTEDGGPHWKEGPFEVIPPLIRFPEGFGGLERDRIAVVGYDKQTLLSGVELLRRLPRKQKADFFIAPEWRGFLERQRLDWGRPGLRVLALPPDAELYDSFARSRLLLGKAGFQQVVEGLLLGAPIVCQACGGGLEEVILASYLKPYVRFLRRPEELPALLLDLAVWLTAPPVERWARAAEEVGDPLAFGAGRLAALVAERAA